MLFAVSSCANAPGKSFFGGSEEKKEEQKAAGETSLTGESVPTKTTSPKAGTVESGAPAPGLETAKENKQEKTEVPPPPLPLSKPKAIFPAVEKDYVVLSGQGGAANIRSGPGRDFAVIGKFPASERFELAGESNELHEGKPWYRILDQNGNEAYVWSGLVEKTRGEKKKFGEPLSPFANIRTGNVFVPPVPDELKQTKELSLNFEAVDIREIIQTFSELLKLDYIIEPGIAGEVTLHTSNKIPVQNLFKVFEQILTMNNIAMIKKGTFYHFIPMSEAKSSPISLYHGKSKKNIPDEDRMIIQIIPLKYILSKNVQAMVAPLLSKNAHFINIETNNTLIIVEIASNMRRLVEIIGALDVNNIENTDIEMFSVNYSDAQEVGKALQDVFTNIGYANTGPVSLKLVPIKSLNSILVVNTIPNLLPIVESWIKKLDQPKVEGQTATFVYYLQNAESGNMASLLTTIYGNKKSKKEAEEEMRLRRAKKEEGAKEPKPATVEKKEEKKVTSPFAPQAKVEGSQELATGEIEGEVSIIADEDTNALIIRTDPKNYPAIEDTIKKLDRMPLQVLIEVMIMDVLLDESTSLGVEWALRGGMGQNTDTDFSIKSSQGLFSGGPDTLDGTVRSPTSIFNNTPGTLGFFLGSTDKVMAMIEAFGRENKANVLSSPIIITSDNKPSSISITDQIPIRSSTFVTQTGAATPITQDTIEYRDVGIKLTVTPKINDDRFVVLEVDQEVSNVVGEGTLTPRFSSRNAKTNVVVQDKETIILGGLMKTNKSNSTTGIPFLSQIPVLGKLFGKDTDSVSKSELLIFITPHVIMNTQEGRVITKEFREKLKLLKEETQQINIGGMPEEAPAGQ